MDGGVTTVGRPQKCSVSRSRESVRRGRQKMSSQPPSVAKPRSASTQSRAEARVRPSRRLSGSDILIPNERLWLPDRPNQEAVVRHGCRVEEVTWPDKETTKNLTLVVIGISAALGALLGGLDWVMQQLFALI